MARSGKTATKHSAAAPPATITSRDNRWLKQFRAALAGDRAHDELVGVEGLRLVEAALGSGLRVDALLVSDSGERHLARIASLLDSETQILRTSDRLFAGVADTPSPQGIAALVLPPETSVESLVRPPALLVVLAGVQDPGNVGTILRAAEAFGATGAATCSADGVGTADPFGPKALRSSAGSALRLPIVHGLPAGSLAAKLQAAGVKVYAAVVAGKERAGQPALASSPVLLPWEADWKSSVAVLIGNEGAGLPGELVRAADTRMRIPQATATTPIGVESLNAAMAATVLLYEAMRQRNTPR